MERGRDGDVTRWPLRILPRTWRDALGCVAVIYLGVLAAIGLVGMTGRR